MCQAKIANEFGMTIDADGRYVANAVLVVPTSVMEESFRVLEGFSWQKGECGNPQCTAPGRFPVTVLPATKDVRCRQCVLCQIIGSLGEETGQRAVVMGFAMPLSLSRAN